MSDMNKKIILGSVLVLILLLLMPSIPAIQNNVVREKILSNISDNLDLEDIRKDIFNALFDEYNWKDIFNLIILVILFLCLGFVETYVSTIMYNEDNDLYPILTELFKMIFFIPAMFFTVIGALIWIIFDPFPDPWI